MERALSVLAGMGIGAGLMYMLDPDAGRRRRALARDKISSMAQQACDAAGVVGRDMKNRAQGVASGDLSVLVGGKRALENPFQGGWSPSGRALMGGLGAGLFLYGLTRSAPEACILGTLGLAMIAEGATNAGISDIKETADKVTHWAKQATGLGAGTSADGRAKQATAEPRELAAEPVFVP